MVSEGKQDGYFVKDTGRDPSCEQCDDRSKMVEKLWT